MHRCGKTPECVELRFDLPGFQSSQLGLLHACSIGKVPLTQSELFAQVNQLADDSKARGQLLIGPLDFGVRQEGAADLAPTGMVSSLGVFCTGHRMFR